MSIYASARLDGLFICEALQAGILHAASSPVVCFMVAAGVQEHPVWALDRLAVVVYAYCQASRGSPVEICLEGMLVSNESISVVVANRVQWHTSRRARTSAERLIAEMMHNGKLPTGWPRERLTLPVSLSDVVPRRRDRRNGLD